jgi:Mitochondrial carrier protein
MHSILEFILDQGMVVRWCNTRCLTLASGARPCLHANTTNTWLAQVASTVAAFRYCGPIQAFVHICHVEGFRTFYRGSVFAYAKVVPSIGVMYMLYELSSQALAIGGLRRCALA